MSGFAINLLTGHISPMPSKQTEALAETVANGIGNASEEKAGLLSPEDKAKLNQMEAGDKNMQSVTWAALVALRDESNLVPGMFYRITDYMTTTTQVDTRSAGHAFDVIVRADSENVLNENAYAIQHNGDTYFAQSNLAAWRLKYCLDNDLSRFAWADVEDGKGVIFFMRDEYNNEAPYDFKNIQYKRYKITEGNHAGEYLAWSGDTFIWAYTFSQFAWDEDNEEVNYDTILDATVENRNYVIDTDGGGYAHPIAYCEDNKIGKTIAAVTLDDEELYPAALYLSHNVFFSVPQNYEDLGNIEVKHCAKNILNDNCKDNLFVACSGNTLGYACKGNTFCFESHSNVFGVACSENWLDVECSYNTFGNDCSANTFGNGCTWNTFGNDCSANTFGNGCESNRFGNGFYSNRFGNNCGYNTFGNYCRSNTFGNYCGSNRFGNDCSANTFGNGCESNRFGNGFYSNRFGNYCWYNRFGNNCQYNHCENNVYGVKVPLDYFCNNTLHSNVRYVEISCDDTSSGNIQNVLIHSGIVGTLSDVVNIEIPARNGALLEVKSAAATTLEI